ncbi:hypothetical protein [Mucilaginibacter psychrotolerans]|uniref:Lipocalin-like domain-containing protein n=1 Tax=Mucilaginibacter psychrotolerans TaxID=1524096 RepID=A0A4Y8SKS8_9SPHI|nr:hypothetical protein [Mucilaginibacter psychrotolerans]TFF39669.1 hypothetical protein E2R66_04695 [Mucilaginibacter psychrotolerans]
MKPTVVIRYCLLLVVVVLVMSSCKKSGSTPANLIGTWNEPANPAGYSRSVSFAADGNFTAMFISSPRPNGAGGVYAGNITIYKGTFSVKRDSLITHISTMSAQEDAGTAVVTPSTQKLFEYATYKVNNNQLTINYTTYPADAPMPTQVNYTRAVSN